MNIIEEIRESILADKGRRTWEDLVRSTNLVSDLLFAKTAHFLLELVQNAEDAGLRGLREGKLLEKGIFQVFLSEKRVKVVHNAPPFAAEDVNAICGLRTTKKPKEGTLGYLGIGFKAVFKVTETPEIHSGSYQFRFAKNEWPQPEKVPWPIIPLPIKNFTETVDLRKTTFILPFPEGREQEKAEAIREEIERLDRLFFFLRWLSRFEFVDERNGWQLVQERQEEKDRIVAFKVHKGEKETLERFVVFRREVKVPPEVSQDPDTRAARRDEVTKREVMVAFPLDEQGNLSPVPGLAYSGVYSFLPLPEVRSGAPFLIQADFLSVPGREAIKYETKWNQWLLDEIVKLVKEEVIPVFKDSERWRFQFLPFFNFRELGEAPFQQLFYPYLVRPLKDYIHAEPVVPAIDGGWIQARQAVKAEEKVRSLVPEDELVDLTGIEGAGYVPQEVRDCPPDFKFPFYDLASVAGAKTFLDKKTKKPDAISWFRKLYFAMYEVAQSYFPPTYYAKEYLQEKDFILTGDWRLVNRFRAYLPPDKPIYDLLLQYRLPRPENLVHPALFEDESTVSNLHTFFTTYLEVRTTDEKWIAEQLVKRLCSSIPPEENEVFDLTCALFSIWKKDQGLTLGDGDMWVLAQQGQVKRASQVWLSSNYEPCWKWENGLSYWSDPRFDQCRGSFAPPVFLSPRYLESQPQEKEMWRQFFLKAGVKDERNKEFVEKFAEAFFLKHHDYFPGAQIIRVPAECDFIVVSGSDRRYYEIKGQTEEEDVELTPAEAERADRERGAYTLVVVPGVPNTPALYEVPNPAEKGQTMHSITVKVPKTVWIQGTYRRS